MPSRCVAAGCDHKDNQLYVWPSDKNIARAWTKFVQLKRDKWSPPGSRSVLCSKHFKDECFTNLGQFKAGLAKRLLLNRISAVPTIHSQELLGTPKPAETQTCRSAFKKRENRRLLEQVSEACSETSKTCASAATDKEAICTKAKEQGTQTRKWNPPIQKNKKIKSRDVGVQCVLPDLSQDDCENCRKRKRGQSDVELEIESEESECETSDEEEIELYKPEFDENASASDSEDEVRADEMLPYTDKCRPHKEPKYIIFHNQLLVLLSICLTCYSTDVQLHQKLSGCMLIVFIKCLCCKTLREWRSQPEIKGTPYGNILLSGSILFAGALPSKVIRLLSSMNIACFSPRTFFRHQQRYLHQAVENGQRAIHRVANPPPLCSAFTRPDKDQAVAEHTTRFA